MKKNFLSKFARYAKYSYHFKLFMAYSAFVIFVVFVLSYFLTTYLNKNLRNEIYQSSTEKLTQVKIFMDMEIASNINSIVTKNFLDVSVEKGLTDFFIGSLSASENDTLLLTQNMLDSIILNNPYVDSIWLYRTADDALLSSREGIIFSLENPSMNISKTIHSNLIYEIIAAEKGQRWIGTHENKEFWRDKNTISFAQTIPFFSHPSKRFGCVIINLKYDALKAYIQSMLKFENEVMIVDADGNVFSGGENSDSSLLLMEKGDIQKVLDDNQSFQLTQIAGKHALITWVKSDWNNWTYISATPVEILQHQINISRNFTVGLLIFFIIISLIGLMLITSYLYKPVKMILHSAHNSAEAETRDNNEFLYINDVITNLNHKVGEMQDSIRKNEGLIKYKIIMDILYGNISSETEARKRLSLINEDFNYREYAIVITDINNQVFQNLPFAQREFITSKVIDVIDNLFTRESCCLSMCHPSHCIVSIVNSDSLDEILHNNTAMFNQLDEFLEQIKYNIEISNYTNTLLSLNKTYNNIKDHSKYNFIYGYGNFFTEDIIAQFERNNPEIDLEIINSYENFLKSKKCEELKRALSDLPSKVRNEGYSFRYVQNFIFHILKMVCRINSEYHIENEQIDKNVLLFDFNNIYSIEECIFWIYNLIDLYDESLQVRDVSIKHEFITRITDYIEENIENQISLNLVAEKFYISPSHLSRLFKDSTGVNFSEFIIAKKFEKAAELLTHTEKIPVSTIAVKLGYSNVSYFNKQFKEKFGVTPIQYRRKHIT